MPISPAVMTAVGALGGTIEVILMQPLVGVKNALQEGRPVPTNPLHLYRGLGMNIMSMAPITASQFGTNRLVQQYLLAGKTEDKLTGAQRISCAAIAGAASAFIASPSELIIIHQQKSGRSLAAETKHFFATHGWNTLGRGVAPCILREGLYASCYLGMFPVLKDSLEQQGFSANGSLIVAGITAGGCGAVFSQPFDTAKTRMQAFMFSKPEYLTLRTTLGTIIKDAGVLTLWKGLLPRMTRIIAATFILNFVRTKAMAILDAREDEQKHAENKAAA